MSDAAVWAVILLGGFAALFAVLGLAELLLRALIDGEGR